MAIDHPGTNIIKNMDAYNQYGQYQRYRQMSLDDMLLENRIVFLIGEINYESAARIIMKMLYLDNLKRGSEISLYVNSPGGSVDDTMAIYDTMRFVGSPVATYCIGRAQSGAAIILAAGTKGRRHALPHTKIMLHQVWGGVTGQAADIKIQAEEIIKAKKTKYSPSTPASPLKKSPLRPKEIDTCPHRRPTSTDLSMRSSTKRKKKKKEKKKQKTKKKTNQIRKTIIKSKNPIWDNKYGYESKFSTDCN